MGAEARPGEFGVWHKHQTVEAQPAGTEPAAWLTFDFVVIINRFNNTHRWMKADAQAGRGGAGVGLRAVPVLFDVRHIIYNRPWCVFRANKKKEETSQAKRSYGIDSFSAKIDFFCGCAGLEGEIKRVKWHTHYQAMPAPLSGDAPGNRD